MIDFILKNKIFAFISIIFGILANGLYLWSHWEWYQDNPYAFTFASTYLLMTLGWILTNMFVFMFFTLVAVILEEFGLID